MVCPRDMPLVLKMSRIGHVEGSVRLRKGDSELILITLLTITIGPVGPIYIHSYTVEY